MSVLRPTLVNEARLGFLRSVGIYNDRQTVIDDGVSKRLVLKKGGDRREPGRDREGRAGTGASMN